MKQATEMMHRRVMNPVTTDNRAHSDVLRAFLSVFALVCSPV